MIIYCHCTRDSALLLSFLLTCHPYFPFSFHEMIFILVIYMAMFHCTLGSHKMKGTAISVYYIDHKLSGQLI